MSRKAKMTPDEMRSRALVAARENFSKYGFYGARVDAIATEAAVNKRMIYEFYVSKKGLYKAVLESIVKEVDVYINERLELTGDWKEDTRTLFHWYFKLYNESRDFVRLLMWESLMYSEEGKILMDAEERIFARTQVVFKKGVSEGHFNETINKFDIALSTVVPSGYFSFVVTRKEDMLRRWDVDLDDSKTWEYTVNALTEHFIHVYGKE